MTILPATLWCPTRTLCSTIWWTDKVKVGVAPQYAESLGLLYVRDDDTMQRPFDAPPVVVNYFRHEEVRKSAKET